jgi:hypothetical protein
MIIITDAEIQSDGDVYEMVKHLQLSNKVILISLNQKSVLLRKLET